MEKNSVELIRFQTIPWEEVDDLITIVKRNEKESQFVIALEAFMYGEICGKREERAKRKTRMNTLSQNIPTSEINEIAKNSKTQQEAFGKVYELGIKNALAGLPSKQSATNK